MCTNYQVVVNVLSIEIIIRMKIEIIHIEMELVNK